MVPEFQPDSSDVEVCDSLSVFIQVTVDPVATTDDPGDTGKVQGSLRLGQFVVAVPDFVLGLLFVIAFLQIDAARRFPEPFLDYAGLFGGER